MTRGLACRLIIICLTLSACVGADGSANGQPDAQPTEARAEAEITLEEVEVIRVEDGDSLVLRRNGVEERARLQGINAPERDECLGDVARQSLADLTGSHPAIGLTGRTHDQYGRLIVHLFADGVYVNQRQVELGNAIAMSIDHPFVDDIFGSQANAAQSEVGLWSAESCGGGPLPDVSIVAVMADPPGSDDQVMDDETVTIRNDGRQALDLTGFVLRDESTINRFTFTDTRLTPGEEVTVASGCNPRRGFLAWCADLPVWNNGGDSAILVDPAGRVVSLLRT